MCTSQLDPFKTVHIKYRNIQCGQFHKLANDHDLVDLSNLNSCNSLVKQIDYDLNRELFNNERFSKFKHFFKDLNDWSFYTLNDTLPGLLLIPEVFNQNYSTQIFNQLLYELPNEHSLLKSNLNLPINDLTGIQQSKLRWLTFGWHYDWTEKIYLENDRNKIPTLLNELLCCLQELLKLDLRLEAGIVNYYTCASKLNPHADSREKNLSPPLLSVSFGEKAIFLVGSDRRYEGPVIPIVLRDGDLIVMADASRLAYHSISKIVCNNTMCKKKLIKRINLNVRQVY